MTPSDLFPAYFYVVPSHNVLCWLLWPVAYSRTDSMSLSRLGYTDYSFLAPCNFLHLGSQALGEASCLTGSYPMETTLLVKESTFRSTPNKELKPSVQQRKKNGLLTNTCVNLGSDPSALVQPWGDTIPDDRLTITSWETMSQNHPARQLPDVWPWEMKVTNVCCLKLLSLGVIYYAEIKQYTSSGEPYTSPTSQIQFLDIPVYRTEAKELHVQWQQADAISNGNTKDFKKLVFINKLREGKKENQESDHQPKET